MKDEKLVVLREWNSVTEAEMAKSILDGAGIILDFQRSDVLRYLLAMLRLDWPRSLADRRLNLIGRSILVYCFINFLRRLIERQRLGPLTANLPSVSAVGKGLI